MRSWSCVSMPFSCRWGAGAAGDGKLFWTGGDDGNGIPGASFWIFHPKERRWCRGPDLPIPISWHSCALLGEELFCVGGRTKNGPTGEVQVYHIPTGRWRRFAPLPQPVWQHGTAVVGEELLCLGGISGGKTLDAVWRLDRNRGVWQACPPLSIPRRGHACQTLGDKVYCMGGSSVEGPGAVEAVEERDPVTGMWRIIGTLPSPGWCGGSTLWENEFLYAGFGQKRLRKLSPLNGCCQSGPLLPRENSGIRLFTLDNYLIATDGICLWQRCETENIL